MFVRECGVEDDSVTVGCRQYDRQELEEALREYGYELNDLDAGLIDRDFLKEILEDVHCH